MNYSLHHVLYVKESPPSSTRDVASQFPNVFLLNPVFVGRFEVDESKVKFIGIKFRALE
jgi:hypothetical protein